MRQSYKKMGEIVLTLKADWFVLGVAAFLLVMSLIVYLDGYSALQQASSMCTENFPRIWSVTP